MGCLPIGEHFVDDTRVLLAEVTPAMDTDNPERRLWNELDRLGGESFADRTKTIEHANMSPRESGDLHFTGSYPGYGSYFDAPSAGKILSANEDSRAEKNGEAHALLRDTFVSVAKRCIEPLRCR